MNGHYVTSCTAANLIHGPPEGPNFAKNPGNRFVLMMKGYLTYGVIEILNVVDPINKLFCPTTLVDERFGPVEAEVKAGRVVLNADMLSLG